MTKTRRWDELCTVRESCNRFMKQLLFLVGTGVAWLPGCMTVNFDEQTIPDLQIYKVGTPIPPLVLPEAKDGVDPMKYSLAPTVPDLEFTAATRTLRGTPTEEGTHLMRYQVVDGRDDTAMLPFAIRVNSRPSETWVPTEYEIHDIGGDSRAAKEIATELKDTEYGFSALDSSDRSYRFRLNNVKTVDDINSVQALIRTVSSRNKVPVDLVEAVLTFGSLEGSARTRLTVTGTATPGATVYLDDGTAKPVVVGTVGTDGKWEISVSTQRLQPRDGWVYIAISKDQIRLFQRTSIYEPSRYENVALDDVPEGSSLRRIGGTGS